jgi:hypothetical protein
VLVPVVVVAVDEPVELVESLPPPQAARTAHTARPAQMIIACRMLPRRKGGVSVMKSLLD